MERFARRTVIIGNSGSGKTTLARRFAAYFAVPTVDLDRVHWEGVVGRKRDEETALRMARGEAANPRWVIEGVYGWLAQAALPRATALIWLNLPWTECRAGLLERGPWPGVDEAGFVAFLAWAEAYDTRQTSTSFAGHERIFAAFPGEKLRLESRSAVGAFVSGLADEGRHEKDVP